MRKPPPKPEDELFVRLRRLAATIESNRHRDRRLLLALQNDLRSVRAELVARRDAVSDQLRETGRRFSAISAYVRTASIARGLTPARSNKTNGVKS
jgi:hypothetical protein